MLLIYALSLGPVMRFYPNAFGSRTVDFFYTPIFVLTDHLSAVEKFYEWYLEDIWKLGRG